MKKLITASLFALIFILVCGINVSAADSTNNRIYYINSADMNRLYSMRSDGSGIKKLSDRLADKAWETRKYIYFSVLKEDCFPAPYGKEEYGIFRIKKDGSDEIFVDRIDTSKWEFLFNDNYICCYKDDTITGYEVREYTKEREIIYVDDDVLKSLVPVSISDNYVYFTNKKNENYRVYFHRFVNGFAHKPVRIGALPAAGHSKLDVLSTDRYCEKGLKWKEVKGAEYYVVSRLNKDTGKYTKLAQTSGKSIRIEVPSNELDAEYKVTAYANGRGKTAKLVDFEDNEKFLGTAGTEVPYNGKMYVCFDYDWKTKRESGIYVYDFETDEPVLFYEGDIESIFIRDDIIYFYIYDKGLFSMDIDGKNVKKLITDKDTERTIIKKIIFTDKSIYMIGEEDISDVSYGDSIFCYDREKKTVSSVVSGEMFSPDFITFITFADDRLIYIKFGSDRLAGINKNGERKYLTNYFSKNNPDGSYGYRVYNGKIYYFDNGLCRINFDGSGFERLSSENLDSYPYFHIYNDKIYYEEYIGYTAYSALCSCDFDGSNKTRILEEVYDFKFADDMLYYKTSYNSGWFRISLLQ